MRRMPSTTSSRYETRRWRSNVKFQRVTSKKTFAELRAMEIRLRAERRCGQLLKETARNGERETVHRAQPLSHHQVSDLMKCSRLRACGRLDENEAAVLF